ncbi:MAG: four helix bundle protein [Candidatus Udaeobacter sp.]
MNYKTELRNKNRGYMKLIVWQKSIELFDLVRATVFTENKIDFKPRSQVADAAQSVYANVSEGYGRRSLNEYIQFLYYALGSLAETMTRAIGLKQTSQITEAHFHDVDVLHYEVENRLLRLIDKLEQKRGDEDWIALIAEDSEEYVTTPSLQHSNTPALRAHA